MFETIYQWLTGIMESAPDDATGFITFISLCAIGGLLGWFVMAIKYIIGQRKPDYLTYEKMRDYYEEKISRLQMELVSNERRWRDANHLIVNAQNVGDLVGKAASDTQEKSLVSDKFFKNMEIDIKNISVEKNFVFVLTPFSEEETATFSTIKKICDEVGWKCWRGDETHREGNLLKHIITYILQADIIITNINGRNPNVFYELGICHAIGKPVIIISRFQDKIPFDVSGKNIIFYDTPEKLRELLNIELLKLRSQ